MDAETNEPSEFAAPRWSVLSFDECAASGLTYAEATRLLEQMTGDVSGLCIVTDEAARRIGAIKSANGATADVPAPQVFTDIL